MLVSAIVSKAKIVNSCPSEELNQNRISRTPQMLSSDNAKSSLLEIGLVKNNNIARNIPTTSMLVSKNKAP